MRMPATIGKIHGPDSGQHECCLLSASDTSACRDKR